MDAPATLTAPATRRGRPRLAATQKRPSGDSRRSLKTRINSDVLTDARARHRKVNQMVERLLVRYGKGTWNPAIPTDDGPKDAHVLVRAWAIDADAAAQRAANEGVTLSDVVCFAVRTIAYDKVPRYL